MTTVSSAARSAFLLLLIFLALLLPLLTGGCATTTTRLQPVAPERVEEEERVQRELVLTELPRAQQRLDDLAFPLLRAALPLCGEAAGPRLGFRFGSAHAYEDEWARAAEAALGLTDTLTVLSVAAGSPAERAGLRPGDRILAADGVAIPPEEDAAEILSEVLAAGEAAMTRTLVVRRATGVDTLRARPETTCAYGNRVIVEGGINAYADGENVIIPWAMMRFANDDELRVIVAHEIAHNAMGHVDAKRRNAAWGALFGAIADVAMASQGVQTGGQYTAEFMQLGAQAYSQDFEREADYVGMYVLARAGVDLESAPDLWRHFAQIDPAAIGYASSHPTTAERFVRLRQAVDEIVGKRGAGVELLPEMREGGNDVR